MSLIGFFSFPRNSCLSLAALFIVLTSTTVHGRPPEIRSINLRGIQIGAATTVAIDGADLLPNPQVFLDDRRIEATVDPMSMPARLLLTIPLPEATPTGMSQFRIATADGFSNSILVGVDRLPQSPITEEIAATQVSLHGSVPGSGVSRTKFPGKAGEELLIEVEAKRLGSKLRPVIHLYDSQRVQIAWASPANSLAGDARIKVKLLKDDKYTVELHDAQYAPPGPSFFRLKIGQWQFADLAFPPVVPLGKDVTVELLGNAAGLILPVKADSGDLLPIVNPAIASGLPPTVAVSALPELIKTAEQPMPLPGVPVAVSGRLSAVGQKDRFLLPVTPGSKIACEVFAERIGSRVDAVLELRNKQGAVVAANDDSPGTTDPRLEYTVPADLDAIEVLIRDSLDLGKEDSIYRLVIAPADKPAASFDVVIKSDAINAAGGETSVLEVLATRSNYVGPIQLQVEGLPPGVQVIGNEIPAGSNGTLLGFSNAGDTIQPLVTRIVAKSPDGSLVRRVRVETTPDDKTPAWMRERLALAATPKLPTPFQVTLANDAVSQLVMASKPAIPLKIVRPPSLLGPVRLSLVTSQLPPKIPGQPQVNPNLVIRAEKPVEVPVDNAVLTAGNALAAIEKQYADAMQQAASAQGDAKVALENKIKDLTAQRTAAEAALKEVEAKAAYQVDYSVILPSQIAEAMCDVSIRAELLNPERNLVLRTTYLPIKRLAVLNPLAIKLDGAPQLETTLDPAAGATVKLTAKVERLADYKGDVTVTLSGLPPGVAAANAVVKADQTEFATEIKIPANFVGNEIAGLKLTTTGPPDPPSGNLPVKSADVEVMIKINRPAK